VWLAVLIVPAVAFAGAERALSVDDVLRLHFAGVSEEIILSEIIVTDSVFDLSVEEILRLQEAGVSEHLLQFMVDTGRADGATYSGDEDVTIEEDTEDAYAGDGEIWVNEIQELEPSTTYHVSLSYSYPIWWYDGYWWDYWYYDCHYAPWRTSFVYTWGGWYPGWYGYRTCWSPAYWGYRTNWYGRHGYWTAYHHRYDYPAASWAWHYDHPRGFRAPSSSKFKSGSDSAARQRLVAGRIKTRNATKLRVVDGRLSDPVRGGKTRAVMLADDRSARGKSPVRTSARSLGPDDTRRGVRTQSLTGSGGRKLVRPVRSPAAGGRPVKIRTIERPTAPVRSTERADDSRRPVRGTKKKVKSAPDAAKPAPDAVRPAPERTRKVRSAEPAPSRPPTVKSPSPRRPSPAPRVTQKPTRGTSKAAPRTRSSGRTRKPRG
jgi:hypothetical protein